MTYGEFLKELNEGKLQPAYLFYGKEDLLCEMSIKRLREKVLSPEECSLNLSIIYGTNAIGLAEALNTPPILALKRLIIIKQAQELPDKYLSVVINYLKKPPMDSCLVLWASEIDKRTSFYKRLSNMLIEIECSTPKGKELNLWIRNYVSEQGKTISEDVLQRLSTISFPSLRELVSELDRLILLVGEKRDISLADLEEAGSNSYAIERWKFADALAAGKVNEAIAIGQNLRFWGLHSTQIIGDLFRLFYRLWFIRRCIDKRQLEEARKALNMLPFIFDKYTKIASSLRLNDIETGLLRIYSADANVKKGIHRDEIELNLLIVELGHLLSGKARVN